MTFRDRLADLESRLLVAEGVTMLAERQRDQATAALEFYADANTYRAQRHEDGRVTSPAIQDMGARARAALAAQPTTEGA